MHKGKLYPWHEDLWAVSAQWWPGWIPRKMVIEFATDQPYPWWFWDGVILVSDVGDVDVTRDIVTYRFPLQPDWLSLEVRMDSATPLIAPATRYSVRAQEITMPTFANAISDRRDIPATAVYNDVWPEGTAVPPNTVYVPPEGIIVRPALWSEV